MRKQLIIGSSITGIIALIILGLHLYVPAFTLFPDTTEKETEVMTLQEAQPDVVYQEVPESFPADVEETANPIQDRSVPTFTTENISPNRFYKFDKRLKADKGNFVIAGEIFKQKVKASTSFIWAENCSKNIPAHQKEIEIAFAFSEEALSDDVLFVAVESKKGTWFFKPQEDVNLLKIPNLFEVGEHQITYGYILKKDVDDAEIPFYAVSCMIGIKE